MDLTVNKGYFVQASTHVKSITECILERNKLRCLMTRLSENTSNPFY